MGVRHSRRSILKTLAYGISASLLPRQAFGRERPRVVVIGGGFAGATCARLLQRKGLTVTLVEAAPTFTSCPFSNAVLAGLRDLKNQQFTYDGLKRRGVQVAHHNATDVDPQTRRVTLSDGSLFPYDRLVIAPGIEMRFDAIEGYDDKAAEVLPHAWKAGQQTRLLRRQLEAMEDGGVVAISAPANPFRCPPGPYERASLIAHYLKASKPRSKILILDAKDGFSKQGLFQEAWSALYPGLIEWVPLSSGGRVVAVRPDERLLITEFDQHRPNVANVIPPQRAGRIAHIAGVADRTGWCPVDPVTFESALQSNIHVIGDATIAGAMPKSAFSANEQAKVCAVAISSLLRDQAPPPSKLVNTCYSLVGPDYGISIVGVYEPVDGELRAVESAGGVSPVGAPPSVRALEADYARGWFRTITRQVFG